MKDKEVKERRITLVEQECKKCNLKILSMLQDLNEGNKQSDLGAAIYPHGPHIQ
jgi:hypothetical protein